MKEWIFYDRAFLIWRQELNIKAKNWQENDYHSSDLISGALYKMLKGI